MEIKDLLPIGTVVRLKEAKRSVMIFGVMQNSASKPGVRYDYISVPYPDGHMDPHLHIAFNHEDIDKILFRGYDGEGNERIKFLALLDMASQLMEKKNQFKEQE